MADGVRKISQAVLKEGNAFITTNPNNKKFYNPGTLLINFEGDEAKLFYLTKDKEWQKFTSTMIFEDNEFDPSVIKNNTLLGEKLVDNSVSGFKLLTGSIGPEKLKDNTFTGDKFKDDSIDGYKIKTGSIISAKLVDNNLESRKLKDGTIEANKIKPHGINKDCIELECIDADLIAKKSITKELIEDGTIQHGQLSDKCIGANNLQTNSVTTEKIEDGAITADKLANVNFSGTMFENESIDNSKIKNLDGFKLLDKTVTGSKLENDTITNNKIKDNTISESKLDSELRSKLTKTIAIDSEVEIDNVKYTNTAYIDGNQYISGNLTVKGDIEGSGDITGLRVFNPVFCDFAEGFSVRGQIEPGDAACLCRDKALTVEKLNKINYRNFIGFVSDEYSSCNGATRYELDSGKKVAISIAGRIHINLPNQRADIGDYVEVNNHGLYLTKERTINSIGRILENKISETEKVLCLVRAV